MKNIYKLLIITGVFLISLLIIILTSDIVYILKYKNSKYYKIGKDKIPSIYKVIGERKLHYYKSNGNSITIKYKNITNVISDLNNYVNYLSDEEEFVYTSDINFSKEKGNISISKNSIDVDNIIIMEISYDKDNYSITITKNKGKLNLYK